MYDMFINSLLMRIFTVVILILINVGVHAQVYETPQNKESVRLLRELNIQQDPRIDNLVNSHLKQNQQRVGSDGFRVEIFFSSGSGAREMAERRKAEFLKNYPEIPVYISFQSPNFRLRIGDFRNRSEALKVKNQIQKAYPTAFIVPDLIQFPKLYTQQ